MFKDPKKDLRHDMMVTVPSRKTGKTQASKDSWIKETQMFSRIAGQEEESYEILSKAYDDMILKRKLRRINEKIR